MRPRSATSTTSTESATSCEECCFPEYACNTTSTKHEEGSTAARGKEDTAKVFFLADKKV
ncbi:hypothetical protein GCM10009001_03190 [Virgibacillus siamensis]|uniref:Uncharacterized protein n=1 Tax=Virgibacillus siamensis TaxID=480071 RepID=A0ABN1FH12_9BACI